MSQSAASSGQYVANEGDYKGALDEGFKHDNKLLAEVFVRGREIECSVLEDLRGGLFVSRPGEIVPAESHGFYTYDAKYIDTHGAALKVPAELPLEVLICNSRHGRQSFPGGRMLMAWPASISSET